MASKVRRITDEKGELVGIILFCPGCDCGHYVTVNGHKNAANATWTYNGNDEAPTLTPSILSSPNDKTNRCHCFVEEGNIRFLGDSYHNLANQVVALPDAEGLV